MQNDMVKHTEYLIFCSKKLRVSEYEDDIGSV